MFIVKHDIIYHDREDVKSSRYVYECNKYDITEHEHYFEVIIYDINGQDIYRKTINYEVKNDAVDKHVIYIENSKGQTVDIVRPKIQSDLRNKKVLSYQKGSFPLG